MDIEERLDKLKTWAIDNYFRFRDVMSPYLENLPTNLAETDQYDQELIESDEADEKDGVRP